ncbi:MAG: zinc-binding dehydrogenase, partial [Planctomycetia bacterium]|nr:zinc-binding dehydrogenase [Planctomycetia bacterium]
RPREGENVLVVGCGTIGLGIIAALRATGFVDTITATAKYGFQKDHALRLGADEVWTQEDLCQMNLVERMARKFMVTAHQGVVGKKMLLGGVDVAYDSVGSGRTIDGCLRVTRANGTVVIVGMGHARMVDWDAVGYKQLKVLGSHGRGTEDWDGRKRHTYEIAQELIASGGLATDGMLTHTFSLEQYREALETATSKSTTRAVHVAFRF